MDNYKKYEKRLGNLIRREEKKDQPKGTAMINCNYYEPVLKLCSHSENDTHICTGICVNYDDC